MLYALYALAIMLKDWTYKHGHERRQDNTRRLCCPYFSLCPCFRNPSFNWQPYQLAQLFVILSFGHVVTCERVIRVFLNLRREGATLLIIEMRIFVLWQFVIEVYHFDATEKAHIFTWITIINNVTLDSLSFSICRTHFVMSSIVEVMDRAFISKFQYCTLCIRNNTVFCILHMRKIFVHTLYSKLSILAYVMPLQVPHMLY